MDKEEIKAYTARVAQANRTELVVIIYELMIDEMQEGEICYNEGNPKAGAERIKKAQLYLQELKGSLDLQYEVSGQLYRLYRYANEQLIATLVRQKPVNLDVVCNMMRQLMDSFAEIAKQDTSKAVMQNSQQVYAGLTYGPGAKEAVFTEDLEGSRGFQA